MNAIPHGNHLILKRTKLQRWLLIASGLFLFIALIGFLFSDSSPSINTKSENIIYKDIPLSTLLEQANLNYEKGNFEKVIPYLEEAAHRGNARAQYSLGYMYQNGEGVNKDINRAKEYYKLSADQGHKKAKSVLKELRK